MKRRRFSILGAALALLLSLPGCGPGQTPPGPASESVPVSAPSPVPPLNDLPESCAPEPSEYVPFTEGMVIDRLHVEYDKPDDYRLDFTFPMLPEELPGAAEFNQAVAADWDYYLTADPAHFIEDGDCLNFDYPFLHIWYEVYSFGQVHEIVVRYSEYSLLGSGPYSWNIIYGYDADGGHILSLEELMDRVDLTEEEVYDFYTATSYDPTRASFDELVHFFYFDADKQLYLEPNE